MRIEESKEKTIKEEVKELMDALRGLSETQKTGVLMTLEGLNLLKNKKR